MSILLLGSKVSSSMFTEEYGGLINMLISRHDWPNIQLALTMVSDLAENELITVLKNSYTQYSRNQSIENSLLILESYLSLILDYNFDHQLLVFSLPTLIDSEISTYLPLLANLLDVHSSIDNLIDKGSDRFIKVFLFLIAIYLTLNKIYNIFSSIIDVHFTFVSTSENFHDMMLDLKKKTLSRLGSLDLLASFEPIISPFIPLKRIIDSESSSAQANYKRSKKSNVTRSLDKPYQIEAFTLF